MTDFTVADHGSGAVVNDMSRSSLAMVRNPLLKLPAMVRLVVVLTEHPAVREAVVDLLAEIGACCRSEANRSWLKHKAPMAYYWKVCGVYVGHIRRAIKRGPQ